MKNWIGRLLGGSDNKSATAGVAEPANADGHEDMAAEIDAAYYRWLVASNGVNADTDTEQRILDGVRALSNAPENASGLVPRVPELIAQLLGALSDENISTAALSAEVGRDLVLVAEVIREANSAYYRPAKPIETLEGAVTMLGLNGLRMLLARIAMRPLIRVKAQGVARQVAPSVWRHSERCAFAASVMAPGLSAGVFESYLAGLMQNVGLQVAFQVADRICEGKVPGSGTFGVELFATSRQLSAVIARHWDFPADIVEAIAWAGDPEGRQLAQALTQGDRIAKLRLLLDAGVIEPEDSFIAAGLDGFQRRCLGKLAELAE